MLEFSRFLLSPLFYEVQVSSQVRSSLSYTFLGTHSEVCLLGDSKFNRVGREDKPSWSTSEYHMGSH